MSKKRFVVQPECFPCFLRQVNISLSQTSLPREDKIAIIKQTLPEVENTDSTTTPAHSTTFLHRKIRRLLGSDPFHEIKRRYNQIALGLYDHLKEIVNNSDDPLFTATRLAIAGNSIDFGIYKSVDIEAEISRALEEKLAWDDYSRFKESLNEVDHLLYLLDNAGEIVFDRILIETLANMDISVTAVVKGSPVINDATMDDAKETGLIKCARVVTNGSDCIGTILPWCSQEFKKLYNSNLVILSKGQGNFETLCDETKRDIFFLFQAKCDVVADFIGVKKGSMLLIDSRRFGTQVNNGIS